MIFYFVTRDVIVVCNIKYIDHIRYFIFQSILKFPIVKWYFFKLIDEITSSVEHILLPASFTL